MPDIEAAKLSREGLGRPFPKMAVPVAIALCFFVLSLLTIRDYGSTWDEGELLDAVHAAPKHIAAAIRGEVVHWNEAELPAHGIALDWVRWVVLALFARAGTLHSELLTLHGFHAALASCTLVLVGRLVLQLGNDARLASLATGALALMPQFIAHSQTNPKDLGGVFTFVWSLQSLVQFAERRRLRDAAIAACALGLALSTRVSSVLVIPVFFVWLTWTRAFPTRAGKFALAGTLVASGSMTLALWPWLWRDPVGNLWWAAGHVSHFWFDAPVQYLGHLYTGKTTPWHYFAVTLAAFTPLPMLALALAGAYTGARRLHDRALFALSSSWFLVLWAADLAASSHYDGVRHLLAIVPSIAILAAVGADWLTEAMSSRAGWIQRAVTLLLVTAAGWVAGWDVYFHPYAGSYVNGVAKLLSRGRTEAFFPLEYWGATYAEGSRWLSANAEPDARLIVPIAPHVASRSLTHPIEAAIPDDLVGSGAFYVMYITRVDAYTPALRLLDSRFCPVFSIVRDNAVLLEILSHRSREKHPGQSCRLPA